MKSLKIFTIILINLVFLFNPHQVSQSSCGGWDPDYYEAFTFFNPISFEKLADFNWGMGDASEDANINEWKAYFQNKPKTEDIKQIVYKVSDKDMQAIRAFVLNPKANLDKSLKNNSLVKYWQTNKDIEAIDYLFYAKVCEPQAASEDEWDSKKRDAEVMRYLADEGSKYYSEKASNDFLKLRFAYQAIRMAHYVGEYQKALDFYEKMVSPLFENSKSIIKYWALSHKAGALKRLKRKAEAAYLFSLVFDNCPSRLTSSFLSFEINEDAEWQQTLALCKSNPEKTTLYFMRSLTSESLVLEEMKSIYQMDAENEKLGFMLVREINKLEKDLLQTKLSDNLLFIEDYKGYSRQESLKYLRELKTFINQAVKEKQVERPELWALAAAYLEYVSGDTRRAIFGFDELSKSTKDNRFKSQIEIFRLALQISELKQVDDKQEQEIYTQVKAANHTHLKDFMVKAFERLYLKQGEKGKAFLCLSDLHELKISPELEIVDNLILWMDKKNKTDFEKEFLLKKIDANKQKERLLEIKATILFGNDNLAEAIKTYQQIPEELIYKIENDPFQANMKDCQECESTGNQGKYNRKTFAQRLLALKDLTKSYSTDQAKYLFQLGNAYYNMTWFGNSWIAIDYYRSGIDMTPYDGLPVPFVFLDCSKAKYYFDRAMNAALKNSDKELAAQSCYMAAKCEQNEYFLTQKREWEPIPPTYNPEFRRYFTRLKEDFGKTKYYDKVLDECLYFNEFVKK